jgi:hypothetical protein
VEEHAACVLVAHLVEMDRRQLDRAAGYRSIFDYCVNRLGLSEDAAYNRMAATRVARKFPLALELLTSGALRPTALRLLEKVLTEANHREVLEAARHKSKREMELLIAQVAPRPDVPASVRKLPAPKAAPAPAAELPLEPAAACAAPARPPSKATRPVVEPLAPRAISKRCSTRRSSSWSRSSRSGRTVRRTVRGRARGRPAPAPGTSRPR